VVVQGSVTQGDADHVKAIPSIAAVVVDKSLYHSFARAPDCLRTATTLITAHQKASIVKAFNVPRATVLRMNFPQGEPTEIICGQIGQRYGNCTLNPIKGE
jgi:hypothetical protein